MAEISLREYQQKMVFGASDAFKQRHKSVLIQLPTGGGKSVCAAWMIKQALAKGSDAWFICHRVELIRGISNTFNKYGMKHGYVSAGLPMDTRNNLMICGIDTLKNRLAVLRAPKLAIFDEAHHCGAAGWAMVLQWLLKAGSYVIGLSATPERLDGIGLDEHFSFMVEGPQPAWLMENGYLSPYRMFCPNRPEINGKFTEKKAAAAMKKMPKLVGDMISQYRSVANGMKFVGFATNVASSIEYARQFSEAGIRCAHLDGGTKKDERERIIKAYANGDLDGVFNSQLFLEGFDLAAIAQTDVTIDCLIDAQPTESYSLQKQKWGRVLRPGAGKVAIINDHAGNDYRHGYPDDEEHWSLQGDRDGKAAAGDSSKPPPVHCAVCFNSIKRPLPILCPHCKTALPDGADNVLEAKPGQMVEVDAQAKSRERQRRKQEEIDCKTLQDFVALAVKRGIKSPQVWASDQFSRRRMRYAMIG